MQQIKLSGIMKMSELELDLNSTGWLFLVNTDSFLGHKIKDFQKMDSNLGDAIFTYNDKPLTIVKPYEHNHIGEIVVGNFEMEVQWKKLWLSKIPIIKLNETPTANVMVFEETQYPDKAIKAANLFTNIYQYSDGLMNGRYTSFVVAKPKFPIIPQDIIERAKKECGTVPYSYGNLLAFIYYFMAKKWIGSTTDDNLTCSEYIGFFDRGNHEKWIKELFGNVEMMKKLNEFLVQDYKLSPLFFFSLGEFYDYYLILKN